MKTFAFFPACLMALLCMGACTSSDENVPDDGTTTYPRTETLGERTCQGELLAVPNPPTGTSDPVLPGMVLALRTTTGDYILTRDGHWTADEQITVGGVDYAVGDRVEISGVVSSVHVSPDERYLELEIRTIR